tara:strand:+ start:981 stop:1181 length:201 start_codon:yes stop_codon:yes gene_type:complete
MIADILGGLSIGLAVCFGSFKLMKYLSVQELKKSLKELEDIVEQTEEIERLIEEHKEIISAFMEKN